MKKMRRFAVIFLIFPIFSFFSCKNTEIHLHDRHVLSYDIVKNYAQKNGSCTLVLLDYHHDIHPGQNSLTSVNWVGQLIEDGLLSKVYWLSGRTLLLPNRNSRFAWLERSLVDAYPDVAEKIRETVELVDWSDLQKVELKKPFVVTLDFDVFTKDTDNAPETFVEELRNWTERAKPELVTLAFSASYQKNPEEAWNWLSIFAKNWKRKAKWILESGDFGEKMESLDDTRAWQLWNENRAVFKNDDFSFYNGAYLWLRSPKNLKETLLSKKISAGNTEAEQILSVWQDSELSDFEREFNREKLTEFSEIAFDALQKVWAGEQFFMPNQASTDSENFGLAVRFVDSMNTDRGCLSLYRGIKKEDFSPAIQYCAQEAARDPRYSPISPSEASRLSVNISIFSQWTEMTSPLDFVPGLHSLIVESESGERTLLQSAIALERSYSREEFLSRLTRKASLGENAWQNSGLRFFRAKTISFTTGR